MAKATTLDAGTRGFIFLPYWLSESLEFNGLEIAIPDSKRPIGESNYNQMPCKYLLLLHDRQYLARVIHLIVIDYRSRVC